MYCEQAILSCIDVVGEIGVGWSFLIGAVFILLIHLTANELTDDGEDPRTSYFGNLLKVLGVVFIALPLFSVILLVIVVVYLDTIGVVIGTLINIVQSHAPSGGG